MLYGVSKAAYGRSDVFIRICVEPHRALQKSEHAFRTGEKTLFALLDTDDTVAAARKIYLSPKTVYTYTNNIGQKLNLNSILQVRQFIHSEFE